jgi:hypothetical protein
MSAFHRRFLFLIVLLGIGIGSLKPLPLAAQTPTQTSTPAPVALYDVFLGTPKGGQPSLYFVDVRSGLSSPIAADGTQHTLLAQGVLFQERDSGVAKIAFPDGRIGTFAAIQPAGSGLSVNWVASSNRRWLAWSISRAEGGTLFSDLYISESDGGDRKQPLRMSSTRGLEALPLAVTDDGSKLFYTRQARDPKAYRVFPVAAEIFQLGIADGELSALPGEPKCLCGAGFSGDGRFFLRLEATEDGRGFDARLWDLARKTDTLAPEPRLTHTQAGHVLISRDGKLAVYTSARGTPPVRGGAAEQ